MARRIDAETRAAMVEMYLSDMRDELTGGDNYANDQ